MSSSDMGPDFIYQLVFKKHTVKLEDFVLCTGDHRSLLYSLKYPEHIKQCLARRRFLINVHCMTESTDLSPVRTSGKISSSKDFDNLNSHESIYRGEK